MVAALLDAGVDGNATAAGGLTPLGEAGDIGCVGSEATVEARLATIDALLQHGANVKWRDSLGNTSRPPEPTSAIPTASGRR